MLSFFLSFFSSFNPNSAGQTKVAQKGLAMSRATSLGQKSPSSNNSRTHRHSHPRHSALTRRALRTRTRARGRLAQNQRGCIVHRCGAIRRSIPAVIIKARLADAGDLRAGAIQAPLQDGAADAGGPHFGAGVAAGGDVVAVCDDLVALLVGVGEVEGRYVGHVAVGGVGEVDD